MLTVTFSCFPVTRPDVYVVFVFSIREIGSQLEVKKARTAARISQGSEVHSEPVLSHVTFHLVPFL